MCLALVFSLAGCNSASQTESTPADSSAAQGSSTAESSQSSPDASRTGTESSADAQITSAEPEYKDKLFGKDVLEISITTEEADWENLMDNAADKPWIQCDITIDGETFKDVGLKTKGNTSLQQLVKDESERYSLKVSFGKYVDGQSCYGLDKLALNNIYADSTYLKEYMSYDLLNYMQVPSSLCTFADITVNGRHYGFFLAVEDADDSYLDRIYGSDSNVKGYKPESMDMAAMPDGGNMPQMPGENGDGDNNGNAQMPAPPEGAGFPQMPGQSSDGDNNGNAQMPAPPNGDNSDFPQMPDGENMPRMPGGDGMPGGMNSAKNGVDLKYTDDSFDSYSNIFDNNINKIEDEDKQRLIASLKNISSGEKLEESINVDEVLRYTACNVFLVNLDSYLSSNCHNYILTELDGQLSMLPWDYNLSFGSYQCESADTAVNYAIDTVFSGVSAEERPIISKLLEKDEYREKYHQYLQEIAEKYVQSGKFAETVDKVASVIDSRVKADTTSFDGYDAFTEGVTTLKAFTELRAKSVLGQLDGTIPSTTEKQKDSDKLIDASSVDIKKLGTMNMGGEGGQGGMPGIPGQQNQPGQQAQPGQSEQSDQS